MKHCGNESCRGNVCPDWSRCRGETLPPWNLDQPRSSTAEIAIREADVLQAADAMAEAIADDYVTEALFERLYAYRRARYGRRDA